MILLKIEKLRRIKYKVEQRYRLATDEDIQEIFLQHKQLGSDIEIDSKIEYEALVNYLKKKV